MTAMTPLPPKEIYLIAHSNAQIRLLLQRMLTKEHRELIMRESLDEVRTAVKDDVPALIIIGEKLKGGSGLDFAAELISLYPASPVMLFVQHDTPDLLKRAMRLGISDYLTRPLRADELMEAIERCLKRGRECQQWTKSESKKVTENLRRRVDELEALISLGHSITTSLNPDEVLPAIVKAAVNLTGAEEGSLLLLDESSGELYMRAAYNLEEDFVRTFRLPVKDFTISSVIKTGLPVMINEKDPYKIITAYLVHSLIYVPLVLHKKPVGALGVDNRRKNHPLHERDVKLLQALAEFAVIALENARLHATSGQEINKLQTALAGAQDGLVVLDTDGNSVFINETARSILNLSSTGETKEEVAAALRQGELKDLFEDGKNLSSRVEITSADNRIWDACLAAIPNAGKLISFHDITHLKELDRTKNDFVNTVSHDLRTPLTAIMGYIELLSRVGPLNTMQQDFIQRVLNSAQSITKLLDELLNLGKIEAGFDRRRESIQLGQLIQMSLESFKHKITEKQIQLMVSNGMENIPVIQANPVQFRQMMDNLLDNAIKYTPQQGSISIQALPEQSQVILQITDNGMGIPAADIPYIFDKFYRAGNVNSKISGTGLGLSIVRSIVECHGGRIWVDSVMGEGTTFTVVLPLQK
ncbi:MAG: GAF domain-containing protein [Anaerolineaceae bacterium]|nr:GAF domain-containing protein [Anaerolineaceae bacterium]